MGRARAIAILIALFLLSSLYQGCSLASGLGSGRASPTQEPAVPASASRPQPPRPGAQAYDFSLQDLGGNQRSLSALRGRKVMLNFWASWCWPCRAEIPLMVQIYGEMRGQNVEILAVNLRESRATVADFVRAQNMSFPVLLDEEGDVASAYFVRGLPTSVFVDEQGIIRAVHVGTLTEKALRQYLDRLEG